MSNHEVADVSAMDDRHFTLTFDCAALQTGMSAAVRLAGRLNRTGPSGIVLPQDLATLFRIVERRGARRDEIALALMPLDSFGQILLDAGASEADVAAVERAFDPDGTLPCEVAP